MSTHNAGATTRNNKTRSKKRSDGDLSSTSPLLNSQKVMLDSIQQDRCPSPPPDKTPIQHRSNTLQMATYTASATAQTEAIHSQKSLDSASTSIGLKLHSQQLMLDSRHPVNDQLTPPDKITQIDQAPSTASKCYLLEIAAELRNRIYQEVLVSTQNISVTSTGFHTNGIALLQTCKQIRSESRGIFFYENAFEVDVSFFNPDNLIRFAALLQQSGIQRKKTKTRASMSQTEPCWSNLRHWIQAAYLGHVDSVLNGLEVLQRNENCNLEIHIVVVMFITADELSRQNVPWAVVETLVRQMRISLITADERWAED